MDKISKLRQMLIITGMLLFAFSSVNAGSVILNYKPFHTKAFKTIEGKVINKITKEPLIFVTVSAEGTNIGTVTNTEGEFVLNIEEGSNVSEISFKLLGFKNKTVPVSTFDKEDVVISMEPYAVPIEEVVVRPENPIELIEAILEKIPENYSTEAQKHIAFYRETIKKKKRYVSISEAVVEVYKAPYNSHLKTDLVKLYKGRKSINVKTQDTVIMKLRGGPKTALLLDVAKNPRILFDKEYMKEYIFEIDEIIKINNKQNYIIKFTQKPNQEYPLYNGKLYVDIKTYAITAVEFNLNLENAEEASKMFVRKKPMFMSIDPIATKYFVKYTEDKDGKYYFSHARGEITFKCNWKRKLFNSKYTVMTEIASTDRSNNNVVKFPKEEQLKSTIVFEEKVHPFSDPDFWGKYNTIKPEESIENTIKKYGVRLKINE